MPEITIQQQAAYNQQRHSSSNALAKISVVAADQRRASTVGQATITSLPKDEPLAEGTRKKSAHMVVTNVIRISGGELEVQQNKETQDASRDKINRKENIAGQKRVIVREASTSEQIVTDNTSIVKNKQRTQFLSTKAISQSDQSDSAGCMTPVSPMTTGKRVLSSDTNVRSLTIEHSNAITLSKLEAMTFACVLRECLEFLDVLRYVIPAEVDTRWDESYKTIAQRYSVPDEPKMVFREDVGLLPLIPNIMAKIQRDRTYVYEVLKKTVCTIESENTFQSLEEAINEIIKTEEGERELRINCELWMEQAEQLQKLIEYDKLEFEQQRKNKIELAQKVNADVDSSIFLNGSKLGYVIRWEDAQLEKQQLKLEQKQAELLALKANCDKMEKADQIVSGEVRTYLEASTREMEDEIMSWTSQYIEELERRQQEMNEFSDHIGEQLVELQELTLLRDSRQAFIDEVLAEKESRKREEEYQREIHRVATLIQAHWRGYMVRKQIGPFKGLWTQLRKSKGHGARAKKKSTKGANKKATTSSAKKKK